MYRTCPVDECCMHNGRTLSRSDASRPSMSKNRAGTLCHGQHQWAAKSCFDQRGVRRSQRWRRTGCWELCVASAAQDPSFSSGFSTTAPITKFLGGCAAAFGLKQRPLHGLGTSPGKVVRRSPSSQRTWLDELGGERIASWASGRVVGLNFCPLLAAMGSVTITRLRHLIIA